MRQVGWATGYALSIYGTEYYPKLSIRDGVMGMAMVGRYRYLKESSMASAGKCPIERGWPDALLPGA